MTNVTTCPEPVSKDHDLKPQTEIRIVIVDQDNGQQRFSVYIEGRPISVFTLLGFLEAAKLQVAAKNLADPEAG